GLGTAGRGAVSSPTPAANTVATTSAIPCRGESPGTILLRRRFRSQTFAVDCRYPGTGPPNPSGPANPSGRGAGSVQPSQTTIAEAIPASWDSDRWIVPTPSSAARRATVPVIENDGRPC